MSKPHSERVLGELLREWRVLKNLAITELAHQASLSEAQIQQLESGGISLFYTASIKENAARKVACLLGGSPDAVIRTHDGPFIAEDSSVMDELVDLSREKSPVNLTRIIFCRQTFWAALLVLTLLSSFASFGWLQKKWQSGGAQQFWHESLVTATRETVISLNPPFLSPPSVANSATAGQSVAYRIK